MRGLAYRWRRTHGLPVEVGLPLAERALDPYSRCECCGVPVRVLRTYAREGPWFQWLGNRNHQPRLHLDHVEPANNAGPLRLLCGPCNWTRQEAIFTDEEVLAKVAARWREAVNPRFLWWLNDSPGEGGRDGRRDDFEPGVK